MGQGIVMGKAMSTAQTWFTATGFVTARGRALDVVFYFGTEAQMRHYASLRAAAGFSAIAYRESTGDELDTKLFTRENQFGLTSNISKLATKARTA
jgi:hypothetical protein